MQVETKKQAIAQPHWDNLFNRKQGWSGADGIYSIPLNSVESLEENSDKQTLLLFSDTFISRVDEHNKRHNNQMVNNTWAIMRGGSPANDKIEFFYKKEADGSAGTQFIPNKAYAKEKDYFWLMDGIAIGSEVYIFAIRLTEDKSHLYNFKLLGVSLLKTRVTGNGFLELIAEKETPFFFKDSEGQETVFGQAIMPFTKQAGYAYGDGYIYIYAPQGSSFGKKMLVARVLPQNLEDFSQWRYWNGEKWCDDMYAAAAITDGISQEFSVTPIAPSKFIAVFENDQKVAIRYGRTPIGPFGPMEFIYTCPEGKGDADRFVYNAKAHPHLSQPNSLLISYNVNCHTVERHDEEADLYRPRFIKLEMEG